MTTADPEKNAERSGDVPRYMDSESFWDQLVGAGVVSRGVSDEIQRSFQSNPWQPIGELLASHGYLRSEDVAALMAMQALEPKQRLGDLAVREGLCSRLEVETAFDGRWREVEDRLLRIPDLDTVELARVLLRIIDRLLHEAGE